jgi:hypothetical protein
VRNNGITNTADAQVPPTATEAQLKTAYKKGALKYHPGLSTPQIWYGLLADQVGFTIQTKMLPTLMPLKNSKNFPTLTKSCLTLRNVKSTTNMARRVSKAVRAVLE